MLTDIRSVQTNGEKLWTVTEEIIGEKFEFEWSNLVFYNFPNAQLFCSRLGNQLLKRLFTFGPIQDYTYFTPPLALRVRHWQWTG